MRFKTVVHAIAGLIFLATALAMPARPMETPKGRDVAAIKEFLQRWEEAFNSGQLERMKGFWTDDVVVLPQGANPIVGLPTFWGGLEQQVQAMFSRYTVLYKLAVDEVDVAGDMAFDRGTITVTLTPQGGGQPLSVSRRYLEILRKQPDGTWKISRAMLNDPQPSAPPPAAAATAAPGRQPTGHVGGRWEGALEVPGVRRRLVVTLSENPDGSLTGTLDSLDSGRSYTLEGVTFSAGVLHFEIRSVQAVFDGRLREDGSRIEGQWQQGGASLPLVLSPGQ